ncbi:MAG: AAA family ATPase [Deltaproteobacteria bacterium]|nr:AAA family ATPase [Deltaproteobacteria bacterium]
MTKKPNSELTLDELRRTFDPALVPFETSDDNDAICQEPVLGQDRAKEALEFGLAVKDMDYHVFVAGPQRTGRTHLVRTMVKKLAALVPPPDDWVYVHNFRTPEEPKVLRFPRGLGRSFAKDMGELLEAVKSKLPEIFESDDYNRKKESMVSDFKRARAGIFSELDKEARDMHYVLRFEPTGIMAAPADDDGNPLPEQVIREMSEEEREGLRQKSDRIQNMVAEGLRRVVAMEKELNKAHRELDRELVHAAVDILMEELFDKYAEMREVLVYLEQVRENIAENFERFTKKPEQGLPFLMPQASQGFKEYEVNVFVDNSETEGAPVVVETNPTFPNLFGRIERQAQFGALLTDFTLLKPGAIHKANGGFLILPMRELLQYFLPYDYLKRALRERKAMVEDVMEQMGFMTTRTLKPEAVPLDLKVILVGDTHLYYLLMAYDPQFAKIFKVKAELADRMDWEQDEVGQFVSHLCLAAKEHKWLPLHRTAVARLVELAAELAGDRERLTLRLADVQDRAREAEFFARQAGRSHVTGEDVDTALAKLRRRVSMVEERMQEALTREFIRVDTEGAVVGQVNGLAVYDLGDHAFGKPSRITASLGLGREGVVTIDRQSELSGPFHTKGVLILGGFLRDRFAGERPLSLTASLVFEQSYSTIDGDSATLAESLVLLSRLAGAPLRQDLAVTGSMSQQGQVQAIGGVNWKVEGFFRLCEARGLTGTQGVVIPVANKKNLMLHPDVVAAAKAGKFHLYSVTTVDEALELFTGEKAGVRGKNGKFPRGTLNWKVDRELARMVDIAKKMMGKDNNGGKNGDGGK